MGSWLRNIQGQLTDLANEVLNEASDVLTEATEEVPDVNGEIIVAKKKAAEAEKQLAIESAKVESLNNEKCQLEQQLYDAHVEMDTIGQKLNLMVKQRDDEIKKLKNQIEQMEESGWNEAPVSVATNSDETIVELRRQVAHWKSIAEQNANVIASNSEEFITLAELEQRVEALRQQKESEIQAIVESHAESMVEMREMYEEKLSAMQVLPYNASSSTSNADTLDAVLLEKEDLLHKSTRSTNGSDGDERPVVVDLGSHDELVDERIRQMEQELERCKEEREHVLEDLKAQNKELATAYNELNEEFEEFKLRNTQTENANSDLNRRIDSLKANLIEYEERYELCKKENAETVLQLEKLSEDFARLRTGVANVSQKREDCDSMVTEEVEKLRASLDETRLERERLRSDVQKFQVAVGEIDVELEKLREANRQLVGENLALQENLARYDDTMKEIIVSSEEDIGKFREQFNDIQENHRRQREAMTAENQALREETEAVKRQSSIIMEESALLKEVNEKLRQRAANEGAKMELLQKKADLLQQVLEEERAERKREKEEEENKNEEEVDLDEKIDVGENSSEVEKLRKHIQILKLQLREALDANTEKTDECEKLHLETRNLEREVDLRQNCVDEMIAQTNTLQIQQESMSSANKTLQTQILANERQIVQLEEKLREETERNQEMEAKVKRMEEFIVGGCSENEEKSEQEESGSSPAEVAPLKKYIAVLQTRLSEVELELKLIKEQKLDESKEAAEVRQMLERDLFEAEEVDRGLLEGIETRVKEMEDQLNAKVEALEEAKKEKEVLEKKLLELTDRVEKLGETKSQADEFSKQNEKVQNKVAYLTEKESGESSDDADDKNSEIIKDLQESNSHLKARLESALEDNLRLTEEASRIQLSSAELAQQANELLPLREELEQIKGYHAAEVTANEGLQAVVESLQKENENLKLEQSTESKDIEELRTAIAVLQQENEHLKGVAKTQYDENVKYYEQFQAMATHNQQMQDQFTGLQKVSEEIQIKLALEAESHDKKAKELQRLREHLLIVEENSTKEAVESEQRETELRARVRELEAKGHQAEEGATESTQQYQVHIASLTSQIESLQGQSSQWQAKYETEVKAREHTQEALSSLQNVVRELSVDHERDAATASHRNLELQTMIGSLQEEIAQIREELDRQSIGRQAAEEESDRRQLQLHSKQKIIEDLEVQIEELRSPRKPTDSYRIDDATLRQLFLSYFVSDSSKRPDIALLLANILEYPPEEMDKFKSAVRQSFGQSSGGSSFFWGSRASPSSGAPTIADQFVRFLEAESESSHTAPHLPIRQQGQPSPGMSLDSSCQISPNSKSNLATVSSSAAALDSLLR